MRLLRVLAAIVLAAPAAGRAATIHVDPRQTGADTVATLAAAIARAESLRRAAPDEAVVIELAPGLHRLAAPVIIGAAAGGTATAPLVIRGARDGTSVLTGSVPLHLAAGRLSPALAARIPDIARKDIRRYALPAAALAAPHAVPTSLLRSRPNAAGLLVFDSEGQLAPAAWPAEGFALVAASAPERTGAGFRVGADAPLAQWQHEPDAAIEGFLNADWLFEAVPLGSVEAAGHRIGVPDLPDPAIRPGARWRVIHALGALRQPGRWWRDRTGRSLLVWPRRPDMPLETAVADHLLEIAGAAHVHVEHLALARTLGDLADVHDSRDIVFDDVQFSDAGARGLVLEASMDSGTERCRFDRIGATALVLHGGNRPALVGGGLFARDSLFRRWGQQIPTQVAAIDVDGVGASITRSDFADAGAAALWLHGNDHYVAQNTFARLLAGVSDAGAVYAGRDWTARGTVIEGNFFHDIRADPGFEVKGVYLDDFASGFTVRRNLFVRVDQPVFIGGGRDNIVAGNLFAASSPAVHIDARGLTWATSSFTDPDSELLAAFRAMPTGDPRWRARYPDLADIMADEPAVAKDNRITGNTLVDGTLLNLTNAGSAALQVIANNVGPDGLRAADGTNLAALAHTSTDPHAFATVITSDGVPVGLNLSLAR